MGFWGSSSESSEPAQKDFTSSDESTSFTSGPPMDSSAGGGLAGGAGDIQEFGVALQQQLMVQTVINDMTDTSFERCITGKPGETLSGKEAACIHSSVNKWLDTNEFMMGRLQRKQQQQQGSFS